MRPVLYRRVFSSSSFSTDDQSSEATPLAYATDYHAPVMVQECVQALLSCPRYQQRDTSSGVDSNDKNDTPLIFVDGTLGGGGHSEALLRRLRSGDVVVGVDVDPTALATATQRLQEYTNDPTKATFVPVQSNFCDLATVLPAKLSSVLGKDFENVGVDGLLLDLGVSSHQIDTAERGFAFMKDGPLDMRMGGTEAGGLTAANICNEFDAGELRRILKVYGDEPRAKAISQAIVENRPLHTTSDLMQVVASVTPQFAKKGRRMGRTATLARVFQSLRIVVNQEDKVLEKALLDMAPSILRPGGRLVVLSYHSMEDRATKRVMRDGAISKEFRHDERDIYGNYIGTPRPFRTLGKPQKAPEAEVESNTRSRSATLRIAERQET